MEKWEDWIFGGYRKRKDVRDIEKKIIDKNLKEIRKQCGKIVDLKKNIDLDAKKQLIKEEMEAEKKEEDKRIQKIKEANLKAMMLNKKLKKSGLICPHCNELTRNIRFIEGDLTRKSVFICKDCGRSFFNEKATK